MITIEMEYTRSTKGTHVYANAEAAVQTLYIRREGLPANPPQTITVTIEEKPA